MGADQRRRSTRATRDQRHDDALGDRGRLGRRRVGQELTRPRPQSKLGRDQPAGSKATAIVGQRSSQASPTPCATWRQPAASQEESRPSSSRRRNDGGASGSWGGAGNSFTMRSQTSEMWGDRRERDPGEEIGIGLDRSGRIGDRPKQPRHRPREQGTGKKDQALSPACRHRRAGRRSIDLKDCGNQSGLRLRFPRPAEAAFVIPSPTNRCQKYRRGERSGSVDSTITPIP